MTTDDIFDPRRFETAQEAVWPSVERELTNGRKLSHWMWFVFPQIAGLGQSDMAQRYALPSLAAARAYFRHPVLGARLLHCVDLVNGLRDLSARDIFGSPDDLKLHSSLSLFSLAVPDEPRFKAGLTRYFNSRIDQRTVELAQ